MCIDLVIVVLGVFIGLQVSNWNDARKEADARAVYRTQLMADLDSIHQRATDDAALYAERALAYQHVIDFLRSDTTAPGDLAGFEEDLALLHTASAPIPRSPTVVELISSGRLGAMFSRDVRVAVVQFDQLVQGAERAAEVSTDIWRENLETINRHATFIERVSDDGRELVS